MMTVVLGTLFLCSITRVSPSKISTRTSPPAVRRQGRPGSKTAVCRKRCFRRTTVRISRRSPTIQRCSGRTGGRGKARQREAIKLAGTGRVGVVVLGGSDRDAWAATVLFFSYRNRPVARDGSVHVRKRRRRRAMSFQDQRSPGPCE